MRFMFSSLFTKINQVVEILPIINSGNKTKILNPKEHVFQLLPVKSGRKRCKCFYTSPLYYQPGIEKLFVRARNLDCSEAEMYFWMMYFDRALLRKCGSLWGQTQTGSWAVSSLSFSRAVTHAKFFIGTPLA